MTDIVTSTPCARRTARRSRPGVLSALVGRVVLAATVLPVHAAAQNKPDESTSPTTDAAISQEAPCCEVGLGDLELLTMEVPVVMTTTVGERSLATVPYAISVITAEDIRRSGARSIPDALRLVPGMDVAEFSYANAAASPRGLHGFVSRDVLVLVDGRQIFDCMFGGKLWGAWPLQLDDIERIEVVRGPAGVTWGGNAVNGVINIITKDPMDQLGLTLSSRGGSRGVHKEHLGYAFETGKLRLRISGEYEASDGFADSGLRLGNLEDDCKTGRMSLHGVYEPGPNDRVTLSGGSGLVDGSFPPTPLAGIGVYANPGTQANFLLGKWSHRIARDNRVELTSYVNDLWARPGVKCNDYRYQQLAFQLRHVFKPADAHTLTWGLDNRVYLMDASNSDPYILTKDFVATACLAAYFQDEWQFAPKWTLNLGGRLDYEFYGGFQPSARASLSYELDQGALLYGAISRAFETPPAAQRFIQIPMLNSLAFVTANREVAPDTLIAYELGYRGKITERTEVNLNLFWHEYDDLTILRLMPGPPGLLRYDFDNGYAASAYGVELDAEYTVTRNLTLLGHYTYQLWDNKGPASMTEADSLVSPRHKFMLGARYSPTNDLHLSSHLYYVDAAKARTSSNPFVSRGIPPYFRLDLRAEYEFWDDRASIAVGVSNLLDANHREGGTLFLTDSEVPRMVYAEFRMVIE